VTRAAVVKSRVVNPLARSFIVAQSFPYLQAEEARVGIHETWCDTAIAPVPMDQNQFSFAHLPESPGQSYAPSHNLKKP
jgi:hypothetical protein